MKQFDRNASLALFRSLRADWILDIARAEGRGDKKAAQFAEDLLLHTDRMIQWLEGEQEKK